MFRERHEFDDVVVARWRDDWTQCPQEIRVTATAKMARILRALDVRTDNSASLGGGQDGRSTERRDADSVTQSAKA